MTTNDKEISVEVDYDHQHGPIVRVTIGEISVGVYLASESSVVTTPDGQYGKEVTGPWYKFREILAVGSELQSLRAELEACRRDAERYRKFKSASLLGRDDVACGWVNLKGEGGISTYSEQFDIEYDLALNAAISAVEGKDEH